MEYIWITPPPATRPVILHKMVKGSLRSLPPPGFSFSNSSYFLKLSLALTKSNGVTAEAWGGHNDLIQRFLIAEHLKDLQEKWGGLSTPSSSMHSANTHALLKYFLPLSACTYTTAMGQ